MSTEDSGCSHCSHEAEHETKVSLKIRYAIALFAATMILAGLLFESIISISIPLVSQIVYASAMLSSGRWIIPRGIRGAAKLHLDVNFLMTVAAFGAFIIGAPAEGAAVMFLFFVADLLERRTDTVMKREIQDLLELEPVTITVRAGSGEACMPIEFASIGDIMIVRPGHRIGLDGRVVDGITTVDQSPITGESLPVSKEIGDDVFAGTLNVDGYIEVEVTKKSTDTVLARIIELVSQTKKRRAPTEKFILRFSHVYTPIVVAVALVLVIGSIIIGIDITDAIYRGLALLVISCPCAFAISIPVSMVSALGGSARDGVLVKGSEFIEHLSSVSLVALDKTGTLTHGKLSVIDVCLHGSQSDEELVGIAASLEQMSEHPIATAISVAADGTQIAEADPSEFQVIPGKGVIGEISGQPYFVGNQRLLREQNVPIDGGHECGIGTMVYVADKQSHLGTIILGDSIRDESRVMIGELKELGITPVMLTGDSEESAKEVAAAVGISDYHASLLPHEKVEMLESLARDSTVLMVGDGLNDSPSLAAADVGVAMGGISSDTVIETADVVLMNEDILKIPRLIRRARKTMSVIKQNVAVSISIKVALAMLSIPGFVSLWVALLLGDVGLTIAVILNALRLTRKNIT